MKLRRTKMRFLGHPVCDLLVSAQHNRTTEQICRHFLPFIQACINQWFFLITSVQRSSRRIFSSPVRPKPMTGKTSSDQWCAVLWVECWANVNTNGCSMCRRVNANNAPNDRQMSYFTHRAASLTVAAECIAMTSQTTHKANVRGPSYSSVLTEQIPLRQSTHRRALGDYNGRTKLESIIVQWRSWLVLNKNSLTMAIIIFSIAYNSRRLY